ncbi:MAG: succinylglutamate desuccinylase/aspartoacylase family protein [Planctomycetia bacterium]|nr:succinylglutamate desuccinylase/aspartoacylase family protein [Planctomycetia bacterium]
MALALERFSGSEPGPHVLITGGVHGDEFEPMAAVRYLIALFRTHPPLRGTVTLVPVVNEPAFLRGSRVGDDGLDLARTCPGRADGSPTQHIAFELSERIRTADYYIDLHTGGTRLRVLPLVGYMLHPDPKVLESQRRMARAFGLPIIWGTDPNLDGRSLSVARDACVPAIYAEYLGGGGCDPSGVDAYKTGCLRVLADVGVIADAPVASGALPIIVEDSRPGSGHMQVNHPSLAEGFFEPVVTLGQPVHEGQILGTVTDLLGRESRSIHANSSGLVLVLHTFARVESGTSVAVILPTELAGDRP